nr:hypothetical protein [Tanacetum cinerariifolium]
MREDEVYKFGDATIMKVHGELKYWLNNFRLGYNEDMPIRPWSDKDQRRTESMLMNQSDLPRDTPLVRVEVLRVILFSIHSDDGNPSNANIKQALRGSNTSSWKSCQGGSSKLNLSDHRFQDERKYEHAGPKVTRSQEGKRLQDDEEIMVD